MWSKLDYFSGQAEPQTNPHVSHPKTLPAHSVQPGVPGYNNCNWNISNVQLQNVQVVCNVWTKWQTTQTAGWDYSKRPCCTRTAEMNQYTVNVDSSIFTQFSEACATKESWWTIYATSYCTDSINRQSVSGWAIRVDRSIVAADTHTSWLSATNTAAAERRASCMTGLLVRRTTLGWDSVAYGRYITPTINRSPCTDSRRHAAHPGAAASLPPLQLALTAFQRCSSRRQAARSRGRCVTVHQQASTVSSVLTQVDRPRKHCRAMWQPVPAAPALPASYQRQRMWIPSRSTSSLVGELTGVLAHLSNAGVYCIYIQQETSGRTAVHLLFSHGGIAHTSGSPHVYNSAARFIRTSVVCQGHDLVELREPVSISVHDLTTRQSRCDGITHLPSIIYCSQVVGVLAT